VKPFYEELDGIRQYITSDLNEDAKRPLVYPLFKALFPDKFKVESNAASADIYIKGELVVELKTRYDQWLEGFYQALHYSKKGLSFSSICIITKDFIGLWKLNEIPDFAKKLSMKSDAQTASNEIGIINAKKTSKAEQLEIVKSAFFRINAKDYDNLFSPMKSTAIDLSEFLKVLKNLDSNRIQINTYDFIDHIESLKKFYDNPIDAVHCFYAIVGYWDVTSIVVDNDEEDYNVQVVSHKTGRVSEQIKVKPKHKPDFKKFVESHYIFTNEGSGITADYYFSRFDEVITRINPEYAKQHGIFFTDINLSKFALWFVHKYYESKLSDKYIVFDPAGGSGNLVTSWHGNLKHKIVSELQPDLLKTIERRLKLAVQEDTELLQSGFTIIPKTKENIGLNFLDRSAQSYIDEIKNVLHEKNLALDKPLAFLLNPPYKNTDENEDVRAGNEADYIIDQDILKLTGEDAGKERYLAFLGQIVNIAKQQNKENAYLKPLLLIFTPTSWLIPRPTYTNFRKEFDKYFKYELGFIITSKEFFKLDGKWPLSFTIWKYNYDEKGNDNRVMLKDYTYLTRNDLAINWDASLDEIYSNLKPIINDAKNIRYDNSRGNIKSSLKQKMYDFKRDPTKEEKSSQSIYGGLPLKDTRRSNKKTYGIANSQYIGFMDDATPCRVKQDSLLRLSFIPDRVWMYLDNRMQKGNLLKIFNGPSDKYSYCAYDLETAKIMFPWFSITKSFNGIYPLWANQYDIWAPKISKEKENYFYSLCFAFALAENRCVVTKFEKDNPVVGTPEVFVDNPLSPNNPECFWNTTLGKEIVADPPLANELVSLIKELYKTFASKYCPSGIIRNVGLQNEAYFKYFDYPDFMTPNSGLIQIKKYAEFNNKEDMNLIIERIIAKTKEVREEIYRLLVDEFKYFE